MDTGKYIYIKHVKCAGCGHRRTYTGKGLQMKYNPKNNWKLLLACSDVCAQKFIKPEDAKPVCKTCNDTHFMAKNERHVMCTQCPLPCEECCGGLNDAFCEYTPCSCVCHTEKKEIDNTKKTDMLMTKKGPIPYREITQTRDDV